MKIRIIRKNLLFYITLFCASLNDILRVGSSEITAFRVMMILAWLIILLRRSRQIYKWIIAFVVIMAINTLQSFFFVLVNELGLGFSFVRYMTYLYFAFCIFTVIVITNHVYMTDGDCFKDRFNSLISITSWCLLFIFIYAGYNKYISSGPSLLFLSNVNNYGMYMNLVIPFHFFEVIEQRKMKSALFLVLSMIGMIIADCKLNLLGAAIEILIFLLLQRKYKALRPGMRLLRNVFLTASVVVAFMFVAGRMSINGINYEVFATPIKNILNGNLYMKSNTSIQYRANVVIIGVQWVAKTYCLGIGYGNASTLMRNVLGDMYLRDVLYGYNSIALHNAPLEYLLEFGVLFIILIIFFVKKVVSVLNNNKYNKYQISFLTIAISMPIWILSPASITTTYFMYIILSFYWITSTPHNNYELLGSNCQSQ